jgi:uncharacterized membrane protein
MTQPPLPPSAPPPPAPPPPAASPSSNRNVMIALAYLWILAVIPLIVEKDDADVQWHAKHGLVLTVLEIILYAVLAVVSMVPIVGCITVFLPFVVFVGFLIVRILAITKALNGERFTIPGISDFANRF